MRNTMCYEVQSLDEYLFLMEELQLTEGQYYFRGENRRYPSLSSSLLRPRFARLLRDNPAYYEETVNGYIHDRASDARAWEREYTLAWCHHEGLPTNLLELTRSPLRALYYACISRSDQHRQEEEGVVYGFAQEDTKDITGMVSAPTDARLNRDSLLIGMDHNAELHLEQLPYLTCQVPYKYEGSDEEGGLYFYQLFQLLPTPGDELPHELIQQLYTPAFTIKVAHQDQILRALQRSGNL